MSVSRVHSCPQQIKVAEGRLEPPSGKCRCRKYIGIKKATEMVKNGDASFIVLFRVRESTDAVCRLCQGDKEVKKCANCFGKGTEPGTIIREDYGNDIVLVSRPPADKKEKKRSSVLSLKTPRVATIESEHIQNAYSDAIATEKVDGKIKRVWVNSRPDSQAARDRIEEYGRLILDARMFIGPNRIPAIKSEPANDAKTGTGRDYDYGRAI
jgi:hypothetical protein